MATSPTILTSQKLEENPVLPLDTQSNLVYTLTRIFRLLAQIVNPLVAWADTWKSVTADNNSINLRPATPPDGYAALRLMGAPTNGGAYINGGRTNASGADVIYWQIKMPGQGDAQGDFKLTRFNPAAGAGFDALSINRVTGTALFEQAVYAKAFYSQPTTGHSLLGLNKSGTGYSSDIIAYSAGLTRWLMRLGDDGAESGSNNGSNFAIHRYSDAGAYLGQSFGINRANNLATFYGSLQVNGAINVSGTSNFTSTAWAEGRITGNANGDVAALYAPRGGIYTEWNNAAALRATAGGVQVSALHGLSTTGSNVSGGTYFTKGVQGNPNWNSCEMQHVHETGNWAGSKFWSAAGTEIQFILSTGQFWGSIRALSFDVQSDERSKTEVRPLTQQHDAFMGIVPISWYWPPPAEPKDGEAPSYAANYSGEQWGFSAQNLTRSVRKAVRGDVEAVDAEGKPFTAGVDLVPISALTVLEVQALWERITTLEARVTELEAA